MTHADDFLALSELLTGEQQLLPATADAHRQRLARAFPNDLDRLIDAYRDAATQPDPVTALRTALDGDPTLARVARETLAIWFTAQFTRPDNTQDAPDTPASFRSGLVWKVIKAHPPATAPLPGGYGHWARHP
ncbi:hypothetical protein [Streptomyces sp. NPDC006463]|uniref:hypothetical protein n=1 Tax=Streptomyces sp. NPDC006463 TaxID=3364746 RepID=UPI0036959FE0